MKQVNIDIMDIIVDNLAAGMTISKALKEVYTKRSVAIPYDDSFADVSIDDLGVSKPTSNALKRERMRTVRDIVNFAEAKGIKNVRNMGLAKCTETMEALLNYAWNHMDNNKRTKFLLSTVERNESHINYEALQAFMTR